MITINLKPGSKRSKGASPLAGTLARFKGVGEKIKDPFRLGALVVGLGVIGFVAVAQLRANAAISDLEPKLEQARTENQRFRGFLGQKKRLEVVRDSIAAQIATIKSVDADRYIWPHILDEVARSVPSYTWLTDVQVISFTPPPVTDSTAAALPPPPVQVQINGRTVDIQGYTRLLRQLEDSPWLKDVTAVSAKTEVEQNRPVTAFVLRASFERPARPPVQNVALSQSKGN